MRFCQPPKHLVGTAGRTCFIQIKNQSDQTQLCNVGLFEVGEAILRTALTGVSHTYCNQPTNTAQLGGKGVWLTCAMPPTMRLLTVRLSSSSWLSRSCWAALTSASDARFTALPAA